MTALVSFDNLTLVHGRKSPANALDHFEPGLPLGHETLKLFRTDHADHRDAGFLDQDSRSIPDLLHEPAQPSPGLQRRNSLYSPLALHSVCDDQRLELRTAWAWSPSE